MSQTSRFQPLTHPHLEYIKVWCEIVREQSGGRIEAEIQPLTLKDGFVCGQVTLTAKGFDKITVFSFGLREDYSHFSRHHGDIFFAQEGGTDLKSSTGSHTWRTKETYPLWMKEKVEEMEQTMWFRTLIGLMLETDSE
jgi:hypothetical protein